MVDGGDDDDDDDVVTVFHNFCCHRVVQQWKLENKFS